MSWLNSQAVGCPISRVESIAAVNLMRTAVVGKVSWREDRLNGHDCLVNANDVGNTRSEAMKERRN